MTISLKQIDTLWINIYDPMVTTNQKLNRFTKIKKKRPQTLLQKKIIKSQKGRKINEEL